MPTEIGTLTAQSSGASTTLTGEITTTGITIGGMFGGSSETHDLTAGDKLYLSYSGTKGEGGKVYGVEQDGTLQTLADYFDSAGAELTVSSISGSTVNTTEGTADFENNSFIIRFTLKDKATDNAINPSLLVLECTTTGEYPLVGTRLSTRPTDESASRQQVPVDGCSQIIKVFLSPSTTMAARCRPARAVVMGAKIYQSALVAVQ